MDSATIIGIALICAGVADVAVGTFVVAPRAQDPAQRRMLTLAFMMSGVLMVGLGGAFLMGMIPMDAGAP